MRMLLLLNKDSLGIHNRGIEKHQGKAVTQWEGRNLILHLQIIIYMQLHTPITQWDPAVLANTLMKTITKVDPIVSGAS